jgi:GT2 family glycosyltransferase
MYAEDIEICLRTRKLGMKVVLNPGAVAVHAIGGSSKEVVGQANSMWIVNLYDLYCSSLASSSFSCDVWKLVVSAGFTGRAFVYSALSAMRPGSRKAYRSQVNRFRVFAKDLIAAKNSFGS